MPTKSTRKPTPVAPIAVKPPPRLTADERAFLRTRPFLQDGWGWDGRLTQYIDDPAELEKIKQNKNFTTQSPDQRGERLFGSFIMREIGALGEETGQKRIVEVKLLKD